MRPTHLALEHFKILDRVELALAPITVLIGGNNAGKSTALQALTLLAQSALNGGLATRGPYLDLGDAPSALINRASRIGDGWSIRMTWEDSHPSDHPVAPGRPITITFTCTGGTPDQTVATEGTVVFEAPPGRRVVVRAWESAVGPRFEVDADRFVNADWDLPSVSEAVTSLGSSPRFAVLPYPVNVGDDRNVSPAELKSADALVRYAESVAEPYFRVLIAQNLSSVQYLGVDRHFTQSAFNLADQVPPFPTDQYGLANVLAYDRDVRRAVDARCREMFGFGVSADFARGRNVDLVAVGAQGETFSVNNMGAGFGQIVWIATYLELQKQRHSNGPHRSIAVPVTCLEEPELHLHPRAQSAAARMLRAYALDGVQQLTTTQNEHLLIALLQQVTAGELHDRDLAVYHLADGRAERLEVDDLGRLSGGLKGFFEANEDELLAQLDALIRQPGTQQ